MERAAQPLQLDDFEDNFSKHYGKFLSRILSLSKMLKNPNDMRGKAKPRSYHRAKKAVGLCG